MSDVLVFDKAKWHSDGDFPDDLDAKQAFVHTGIFVGWIIEAGLFNEDFADDFSDEIRRFKSRELTGPGVYRAMDGVFADDMLSEEGSAFSKAYFDFENGDFLKDYDEMLSAGLPSMYHVSDTWDNFDTLTSKIHKRYAAWQKT